MTLATSPDTTLARDLAAELEQRVSGEVRLDDFSRTLYSTDASIYQMKPVGVVTPRDADDVVAVVELANREGIPVLPGALAQAYPARPSTTPSSWTSASI